MPKRGKVPKSSAFQKPRAQSRGHDGFIESLNHLQDQQSPFFSLLSAAVNNMVSTVQHFIQSSGNSSGSQERKRDDLTDSDEHDSF